MYGICWETIWASVRERVYVCVSLSLSSPLVDGVHFIVLEISRQNKTRICHGKKEEEECQRKRKTLNSIAWMTRVCGVYVCVARTFHSVGDANPSISIAISRTRTVCLSHSHWGEHFRYSISPRAEYAHTSCPRMFMWMSRILSPFLAIGF